MIEKQVSPVCDRVAIPLLALRAPIQVDEEVELTWKTLPVTLE
jgi:hypothetical protein